MATQIKTDAELGDLVKELNNPARKRPICVISIDVGQTNPNFDVAHIEKECGDVADFFTIETGQLTYRLEDALPPRTHVFGGAARSYPIDFASTEGASVGHLRHSVPKSLQPRSTQRLIGDVLGHALAAGLITGPKPGTKLETAVVKKLIDSEVAVLERHNGGFVSLVSKLVFPGVPLDRVLHVGQEVSGFYDEQQKLFTLEHQSPTLQGIVDHYGLNNVTLGLVRYADRKMAKVALHPNLIIDVRKDEISGNARDVVTDYRRVGMVYPFRIYRDPQGHIRLRCDDIEDDEVIAPALALMPNGDPWLQEDLGVIGSDQIEAETEEAVVSEVQVIDFGELQAQLETALQSQAESLPLDTGSLRIAMPGADGVSRGVTSSPDKKTKQQRDAEFAMRHYKNAFDKQAIELRLAKGEAERYAYELNGAMRSLNDVREELRLLREDMASLRKEKRNLQIQAVTNPWNREHNFETQEEWLREEVRRAWLDSYEPSDRREFNIDAVKWSFGKHFFDGFNVELLNEVQLRKTIRTIVDLVSGRNEQTRQTEFHPVTENGKPLVRDGDKAMRMYIEEETPGARRLHYWKLAGGGYDLNQVVIHDTFDMR